MQKPFTGIFSALAVAVLGMSSAMAQTAPVATETSGSTASVCLDGVAGAPVCYDLLAGQTIHAGSVCLEIAGGNLNVVYATVDGWELTEAQLWIGNDITDLPQNKAGNPVPGQFPFKSGDITGATLYQFSIPLTNPYLNFACPSDAISYFLAAHASVRKLNGTDTYQTQTGWTEGSPITSRGNWATFSTFTLGCCSGPQDPGGDVVCETSFAKAATGSTCFLDLGFERWGWSNGPLVASATPYVFDLYAGAGQCDTTKGALVGTLTVNYDGAKAVVTYTMTAPGWWLDATHLYVGSNPLPLFKQGKNLVPTVAPGQYPNQHEELESAPTDTYTVNITGPIYVVAHAVTCHFAD